MLPPRRFARHFWDRIPEISSRAGIDLITQPLFLDALAQGEAKGKAKGMAKGKAKGKAEGMAKGKAKGKAEGMAEGKAEGMAEGRADLLLHLFRQRFGAIPEGVEVKVRSAQPPDLEAWADALFDARKLDDVFRNGGAR